MVATAEPSTVQATLEQPRYYGATRVGVVCDQSCGGIPASRFEEILRSGREVVWDVLGGDHSVLMVGYDRTDPANPYFIVKDSYGYRDADEDGFIKYSYLELDNDVGAGYIEELRPAGPWPELRFFGRWSLSFDGHRGVLDVYHVPGTFTGVLQRAGAAVRVDRRIGTFFDEAGNAFRINGSMSGDRITFYLDASAPDLPLPYDRLAGRVFTYYLSGSDALTMAGTHRDGDGSVWPGYARKLGHVWGSPRPRDSRPFSSLLGRWTVLVDGRSDALEFRSLYQEVPGSSDWVLTGVYRRAGPTGPRWPGRTR